jgi:hypothetical protein
MRKVGIRGPNATVRRSTAALDANGVTVAANVVRKDWQLWTSPTTFTRIQDSANADYYPLDTCTVNGQVICALASAHTSHSQFTQVYKTNGIPDGSGDFTFTEIAHTADAPFSTAQASGSFTGFKVLDDGSWLLAYASNFLFRSVNAGGTWTIVLGQGAPVAFMFSFCGVDGAHICLGSYDDRQLVYVSHDYGATWECVFRGDDYPDLSWVSGSSYHIHTVCWDPTSNHSAVFIMRGDGVNCLLYRIAEAVHTDPTSSTGARTCASATNGAFSSNTKVAGHGTSDLSLSVWLYPTSYSGVTQFVVSCGGTSNTVPGQSLRVSSSTGLYYAWSTGVDGAMPQEFYTHLPIHVWTHVFAYVDRANSNIYLYRNGTLYKVTAYTGSASTFDEGGVWLLGKAEVNYGYVGRISKLGYFIGTYDHASAAVALWNNGAGLLHANLPAYLSTPAARYYDLGESSGNAIDATATADLTAGAATGVAGGVSNVWPYSLDTTTFYRDEGVAISGVTLPSGTPAVVSTNPLLHGLGTGDVVRIYGAGGTVELNSNVLGRAKEYTITYVDDTSFTLDGTDGDNFTAWSSSGVVRQVPVGVSQLAGEAMSVSCVATADAVYLATESRETPLVMKYDIASKVASRVLWDPDTVLGIFTNMASRVCFAVRKTGTLYYLTTSAFPNKLFGEIFVSEDLIHWASIRRTAITGTPSFWGYLDVHGTINGNMFCSVRTAAGTSNCYGEYFPVPKCRVSPGFSVAPATTNLLSVSGAHTDDDATFSTATHGWTGSAGLTLSLSTAQQWTGAKSLKVANAATALKSATVTTPAIVAALGCAIKNGDYLTFRCRIWIPEAYRTTTLGLAVDITCTDSAAHTTDQTSAKCFCTNLADGWASLWGHAKITADYASTDDLQFAVTLTNIPASAYIYIDGAEIIVRKTDRQEYLLPFVAGTDDDEEGVIIIPGTGTSWTACFLWRPEMMEAQIDAGNVPICRIGMTADTYIDLLWIAASTNHGKFSLQRTTGGSSQTGILSAVFQPFANDVLGVAIGTDNANSKIYAKIHTPTGVISIEDANTDLAAPTTLYLGSLNAANTNGTGTFNCVQVHNGEFITDATTVLNELSRVNFDIHGRRPGLLLPI